MSGDDIKVLVVDDEDYLLELSRIFLEQGGGIKAFVACSGKEALDMIALSPYDVIVSDYQMPEMDGLSLLGEMKSRAVNIPFILFTGKGREEVAVAALNLGAAFYLQKGGDPKAQFAELRNMIHKAAGNKMAERLLKESEDKFHKMFEDSSDANMLLRDGIFVDCNRATEKMFQMERDNIIGKGPVHLSPTLQPDGVPSVIKADVFIHSALRTGFSKFEWKHRRSDGEDFWTEISLTALSLGESNLTLATLRDITDRKNAELALKESELRFRSVVSNSDAISFVLNKDGMFSLSEGRGLSRLGLLPGQVVGMSVFDLYRDHDDVLNGIRTALTGKVVRLDAEVQGRTFDVNLAPIFDEKGDVQSVIGISNDITERAMMMQERDLNSRRMQALLELNQMSDRPLNELAAFAMEEAVKLTNSSLGYIAFLNDDESILTMHAWSSEAMKECAVKDKPREYPVKNTGLWGETVRQRRPIVTNNYLAGNPLKKGMPEGHVHLSRHMGVPIFDANKIVIVAGVGNKRSDYDETDLRELTLLMEGMWRLVRRKKAEVALQESERRLADIINLLPDPTMVVNKDGTVEAWNKAMEELSKVASADIVGKGRHEYALPFYGHRRPMLVDHALDNDRYPRAQYDSMKREGDVITADDVNLRIDGKVVVLWASASPFFDREGNVIGAIETIRDVTDKKRTEAALLQTNRQLHTLSDITRHDILNTLTALRGHVALDIMKASDTMFLDHLRKEDKLLQKIDDQIQFTKEYQNLGVGEPKWQSLSSLIEELDVPPGVRMESDCDGYEVYADPMLFRVFYNLLDNSVRHGKEMDRVRVHSQMKGDVLKIVFEDNGVGVQEWEREIIFQRGYGKNTGLGLFLIREILSITGMKIVENGIMGGGARFEITVPKGSFRKNLRKGDHMDRSEHDFAGVEKWDM